jgi:transcription elongation factor GreA
MEPNPLTSDGYEKLSKELFLLMNKNRMEVAKEIESARENGSLDENDEYKCAKEKQERLENKIIRLNEYLSASQIIKGSDIIKNGSVVFGSRVRIMDCDTEEEKIFKIVGVLESNVSEGQISYQSPLARSLMGKLAGEDVEVEVPSGVKYWDILEVLYD